MTSQKRHIVSIVLALCLILSVCSGCGTEYREPPVYMKKPVICLYPKETTAVSVILELDGSLTCTYPAYENGWTVTAEPNGTLHTADGREYNYLYWEGKSNIQYDMSQGYVIKGEDTAEFLQQKLAEIGLSPRESNEFIVYWLPQMQENPYNLITFQQQAYTEQAKLTVTPKPDSVLRVFMAYQALEQPVEVEEPTILPFERNGFTVVEWGGTEIK